MQKLFIMGLLLSTALLGSVNSASANYSVYIDITDAYYADLDSDGFEDDIRILVVMDLYNYKYTTDIDLYVGIEKPLGEEVWFLAEFLAYKTTYHESYSISFNLLNTATESGWYTAYSVGFADNEQFSIMSNLLFDPPGVVGGDPPSGTFTLL